MCVYCFEPVQSPVAHGAFWAKPSNIESRVTASSTRSGVHQALRRTPARRPQTPPIAPVAWAAVRST